jgi:hypothetical protein
MFCADKENCVNIKGSRIILTLNLKSCSKPVVLKKMCREILDVIHCRYRLLVSVGFQYFRPSGSNSRHQLGRKLDGSHIPKRQTVAKKDTKPRTEPNSRHGECINIFN